MSGEGEVARALEEMPLGAMMGSLATEVMSAQLSMDRIGVRITELMSRSSVTFDGEETSLLALGFSPTFYQYVETTLEVKVSFSFASATSDETADNDVDTATGGSSVGLGLFGLGASSSRVRTQVSTVDARLASRYQHNADSASAFRTRLVPVPPPPTLLSIVQGAAGESQSGS